MRDVRPRAVLGRLFDVSPVLAALALHAVAHGRWVVCAPVMVALAVVVARDARVRYSPARLIGAGVVGTAVGTAMLWVSVPPTGIFPASFFGPLCGALGGLSVFCALGRERGYAWTYACLLVSLSLRVRGMGEGLWVLGLVAVSVLAVGARESGLLRSGGWGLAGFGVFLLLLFGGSGLLVVTLWRAEGKLVELLYQFTRGAAPGVGVDFQSQVDLRTVERKPPGSERPLLVLSGGAPERLRTRVFDTFDGAHWTTSEALADTTLQPPSPPVAKARWLTMTVLSPVGQWLPTPGGTLAVEGSLARMYGGWVWMGKDLAGAPLALRGDAAERLPEEAPPGPALTALPESLRAELRPLALGLTAEAASPRAKAERLEAYFRDGYEYSLNVDLAGEGSALAVLVREKRAAYCTYFASAMAALLRSVDVPARMVGGFAPGEGNALLGAALVRERDAHAWVEVYLADEGRYVAFDPTPWRSRDEALGLVKEPSGRVGQVFEALGIVLRELGAGLYHQPLARLRAWAGSPGFWGLVIVGALWRWGRRWRARGPVARRKGLGTRDTRLVAVYARYLKTLERRARLVPHPTETDEELLGRLRVARGEAVAALAAAFLEDYREARYRGGAVDPTRMAAGVERLDAALREAVPGG
ncbi:transglutaminase-like domain-containing protein [Archangium primigenium]|uniref:transglutaminase-like domain-containing protein n=1 Tax=[Archangium] primigenium TaxID=2792470 RepID=UPI001957C8D5|nr:transglutaminase-like domain-containing protein [Archangium primigenium]MBM7112585.1 transglutaminase domain-containing protein [Archangium primigenium]